MRTICKIYAEAPRLHEQGAHVISTDEKTGIQAIERIHPTLPTRPGKTERVEFEYRRHGTLCLIANFDVATGKLVRSFEGHTHHVLDVSWRADGKVLASSGADSVIKIWNFETGDQIKTVSGFGKEVTSLAYVGLGNDLLACSGDKTIRINNRKFAAASDFLHACAVSIDGQTVVAGGQGGILRVWNAKDGKIRDSFEPQPADNAQAAK